MIQRAYIAGPMKGIPEDNFPAFDAMADCLVAQGYAVANPADIARGLRQVRADLGLPKPEREHYLRADLAELVLCDALFLLPGWEASEGAILEYQNARAMGMEVIHG